MKPVKVLASTVDMAEDAGLVPKSVAKAHCTVVLIRRIAIGHRVVVTVVRGECHVVTLTERITISNQIDSCTVLNVSDLTILKVHHRRDHQAPFTFS